jgi:hypothetical protein
LANARARADALTGKGLRGIKVGPRPESGVVRLFLSGNGADKPAGALAGNWPKGLQPGVCAAE